MNEVCARAAGEWLLIGGGLVALWLEPRRTTADLDIFGLGGDNAQRLALMQIADSLGLPVETMNGAADFFVYKISDWRQHLVEFRRGAAGIVFRPDATLFLLLKLRRLDDRDLADCRALLAIGEPFDRARVLAAISALPATASGDLAARRSELERLVATPS